jgi:hypothetical protein
MGVLPSTCDLLFFAEARIRNKGKPADKNVNTRDEKRHKNIAKERRGGKGVERSSSSGKSYHSPVVNTKTEAKRFGQAQRKRYSRFPRGLMVSAISILSRRDLSKKPILGTRPGPPVELRAEMTSLLSVSGSS